MDCHCGQPLACLEEIFLFTKEEKQVHLSIKPEVLEIVKTRSFIETPKGRMPEISCKKCKAKVGKNISFGPAGSSFYAFGIEKVILLGHRFTKKQKWFEEMHKSTLTGVERRDVKSFLPDSRPAGRQAGREWPDYGDLVWAQKKEDFEWSSLLVGKVARDYQYTAYVEALQKDAVVVQPTGTGKTLIACLLLARMCRLNPHRMGLFVVDRIPLVYQQAQVVREETSLRTVTICGENRTAHQVNRLYDDSFDVVVATAGVITHMLEVKDICLDMFCVVVLDEVHHCSKRHKYAELLTAIHQIPDKNRKPRVLGLTASPFNSENLQQGETKLAELRSKMETNCILRLTSKKLEQEKPEWITVTESKSQTKFKELVRGHFSSFFDNKIRGKLATIPIDNLSLSVSPSDFLSQTSLKVLKGKLTTIEEKISGLDKTKLEKDLTYLRQLIEAVMLSDQLGSLFAVKMVPELGEKAAQLGFEPEVAPKLQALEALLSSAKPDSKVLTFVDTRSVARTLTGHLATDFADFNPKMVVGHGGFDGQHWKDDQDKIIDSFHKGTCRLLITTTVLEEGIDVSDCDLVIRFAEVHSLIKFIQSQGRARKQNSRFILLVTEEEKRKAKDIEAQESVMDAVLGRHARFFELPSQQTQKLVRAIQADETSSEVEASPKKNSLLLQKAADLTGRLIHIYVIRDKKTVSDQAVKDELEETLDIVGGLEIERIEFHKSKAREYSLQLALFNEDDDVVLVDVSSRNNGISEDYLYICRQWNFTLQRSNLRVYTQLAAKGNDPDNKFEWNLSLFGCGNFLDGSTFEQKFCMQEADADTSEIKVSSESNGVLKIGYKKLGKPFVLKVSLRFGSLGFGLVSWEDGNCNLFIPLESMPYLYTASNLEFNPSQAATSQDSMTRVVGFDSNQLLKALKHFPVLVLRFKLDNREKQCPSVLQKKLRLKKIFPVDLYDTRVTVQTGGIAAGLECFNSEPPNLDIHERKRLLECESKILSVHTKFCLRTDVETIRDHIDEVRDLYQKKEQKKAEALSLAYSQVPQDNYWLDLRQNVEDSFQEFNNLPEDSYKLLQPPVPEGHFLLPRMVITPTRIVWLPSVPVWRSRLSIMLKDSHLLTVVYFRDEKFEKVWSATVFSHFLDVIENGITLFGRKFMFLFPSSSQIRDHKAYFVSASTKEEVADIRQTFISQDNHFPSSAKYLARLSLFCTGILPTVSINPKNMEEIVDEEAQNGSLVTDGSGFIALSLAEQVFLAADVKPATAFQFRLAGMKGVLVCLPDNDVRFSDTNKKILYRPSQKKFESDHMIMCLVRTAKVYPVTLNRESITLLESLWLLQDSKENWNWSLKERIQKLQVDRLLELADIFHNSLMARGALMSSNCKPNITEIDRHFNLLNEPYWFKLLSTYYLMSSVELSKKTNIPVRQGCMAMGIPDPSDVLKTDQVFLKIVLDKTNSSDSSFISLGGKEEMVIEGFVLIYRNPCLHPGDLRIVKAINCPELSQFCNVLVLPGKNSAYSLAESCSGGDLDGDIFSVIWDSSLVPPVELLQDPLPYDDLPKNVSETREDPGSQTNLAKFYISCMNNDALGRVAHMHLAFCDHQGQGALDPLAIKLAESQAMAVDYPKTGVPPEVPEDALKLVRDKGYPDFMEKSDSNSYTSKKLLGELYQESKSILFNYQLTKGDKSKFPLDEDLVVKGHENYLKEAGSMYKAYRQDMKNIIYQYSLQSEGEVYFGRAINWHPLLNSDGKKIVESLERSACALQKKYQSIFKSSSSDREMLASACYVVTYNQKMSDKNFLSFPWLFSDTLCAIKMKALKPTSEGLSHQTINYNIGVSAMKSVKEELHLEDDQRQKQAIFDRFCKEVSNAYPNSFSLHMYGSVSVFLSDVNSDIDICVEILPQAFQLSPQRLCQLEERLQHKHFLENYISFAIDTLASKKTLLTTNEVPVIRTEVTDDDTSVCIDISCNKTGLAKTAYIQGVYKCKPAYYLVFRTIVKWARCCGLLKLLPKDTSQLATAEMYALIIEILKPESCSVEITDNLRKTFAETLSSIKASDFTLAGKEILRFFRIGQSFGRKPLCIKWPEINAPEVIISETNMYMFSRNCLQALHCLQAKRDIAILFSTAFANANDECLFEKQLPLGLSYSIGIAPEFHAHHLSLITGAQVQIQDVNSKDNLTVIAKGSRITIAKLRQEIINMTICKRALKIGIPKRLSSRYFMAGSSLIYVVRHDSNVKLFFPDSQGGGQLKHTTTQRSCPAVKFAETKMDLKLWEKEVCVPSLNRHFQRQFASMEFSKVKHSHSCIEVTARFGCCYIVDVSATLPDYQTTLSLSQLLEGVEKGRRVRKTFQRGKFVLRERQEQNKVAKEENSNREQFSAREGQKKEKYKMVKLPRSSGNHEMSERKKSRRTNNAKRKGVSMNFCPGVVNGNYNRNPDQDPVTESAEVFRQVLKQLNFTAGKYKMTRETLQDHFKVSICPSSGYELQLVLDRDLKFVSLDERPLSWVHVTLLHGEEVKPNPQVPLVAKNDVRLLVQTVEKVSAEDDLFKFVYPSGLEKPPLELDRNGQPVICKDLNPALKFAIKHIKEYNEVKVYNRDGVNASIVIGTTFLAENLTKMNRHCDLSLYFHPDQLVEGLEKPELMETLVNKMVTMSMEVSAALEQNISRRQKKS